MLACLQRRSIMSTVAATSSSSVLLSNVVVRNGIPESSSLSFKDFLTHFPRGAYTTCRTLHQNRIVEYDLHVHRLLESARLMMDASTVDHFLPLLAETQMAPRIQNSIQTGVSHWKKHVHPGSTDELKITLLLFWSAEHPQLSLCAHLTSLGRRPSSAVTVQVGATPRQNAKAKDSQWVVDRQAFEAALKPSSNEMLLVDAAGNVTEGLSSNFFAVRNQTLYTSSDVLDGTIRRLVLDIAAEEGIAVVWDTGLNVDSDASQWDECFLTSTSRLVLPVAEVELQNGSRVRMPSTAMGERLYAAIMKRLESVSPVVIQE